MQFFPIEKKNCEKKKKNSVKYWWSRVNGVGKMAKWYSLYINRYMEWGNRRDDIGILECWGRRRDDDTRNILLFRMRACKRANDFHLSLSLSLSIYTYIMVPCVRAAICTWPAPFENLSPHVSRAIRSSITRNDLPVYRFRT